MQLARCSAQLRVVLALSLLPLSAEALCTYGTTAGNAGKTCREIILRDPDCYQQSGLYWVTCGTLSTPVQVYCEMGRLRGGWERLAKENFTGGASCPDEWVDHNEPSNGLHYCTTNTDSAKWAIQPVCPFSEVNGYVLADQKGFADAFHGQDSRAWDSHVDGVTIFYRHKYHVFTYAVGMEEKARMESCECHGSAHERAADWLQWNFMCDSAQPPLNTDPTLVGQRVLWTGRDCGPESRCCHRAGAPWFYRSFPRPTSQDVRVVLKYDNGGSQGGVLVREVELYVR